MRILATMLLASSPLWARPAAAYQADLVVRVTARVNENIGLIEEFAATRREVGHGEWNSTG